MTYITASNNLTNQNNSSTIKVLIFDGDGVMGSSVNGIEDVLMKVITKISLETTNLNIQLPMK